MTLAAVQGAASATPWWLPLFTAGAGLVGTLLGGLITFLTSTSAHRREEKAERERQRRDQMRDVSVRFIQAVSKQRLDNAKIQESAEELKELMSRLSNGEDPAAALAAFKKRGFDPDRSRAADAASQLELLNDVLQAIGAAESTLSEAGVIVAEMRLLLPNHIVRLAGLAASVNFTQQLYAALPMANRIQPSDVSAVMNRFINAVRAELGMDEFLPLKVRLEDLEQTIGAAVDPARADITS